MHPLRTAIGMVGLSCAFAIVGACRQDVTGIALTLYAPQGLLDDVTRMELRVVGASGLTCDPASGEVTGTPDADAEILDFALDSGACAGGATWCKTITLDKDGEDRVFRITGFGAGNEPTVQGCATATVDQDPLEVKIQALRFVEPRCCNDGKVQPNEQCDTGVVAPTNCAGVSGEPRCLGIVPDFVCECDCLAKEILISRPNVAVGDPSGVDDTGDMVPDNIVPPSITNNPGSKGEVAIAFSGTMGQVAKSLRAVFIDSDATGGNADIDLRMLTGSMYPITINATFMKTLRLPRCVANTSEQHRPFAQKQPALAKVSESIVAVVFANNEYVSPNYDISLSAQGPNGCDDGPPLPLQVNFASAGTNGSCDFPAIEAGPSGTALVVWNQAGTVRGRIYDSTSATTPFSPAADIDIGLAPAGSRPRVAGNAQGWVVVFQGSAQGDPDAILFTQVLSDGSLGMKDQLVNAVTNGLQETPDVAMLPSGEFVVVWNALGNMFFQRYDASAAPLNNSDQNAPLQARSPLGQQPVVAASATDNFYAVAWAAADGAIWGRLIDGFEGFRLNNVTGQNDDFTASHPAVVGTRFTPDIAIGGDGYIAIAWLDTSPMHFGVWGRRFPLPGQ